MDFFDKLKEAADSLNTLSESLNNAGKESGSPESGSSGTFANLVSGFQNFANTVAQNTKKCPNCGALCPADNEFCPQCGTRLAAQTIADSFVCPSCGFQNEPGARLCGKCGTKLTVQETAGAAPAAGQGNYGYVTAETDDYVTPEREGENLPCRDKILKILAEEFPEYTVYEELSPAALGGTGKFMNYSIAVAKDSVIQLVIMIIGKTTSTHREYRWSKEFALSHGMTFLNFVQHYPNRLDYISDRLHKYL